MVTAPEGAPQEQSAQPELTDRQMLNWLVNEMYEMRHGQQQPVATQQAPETVENVGVNDIYNETFNAPTEQPAQPQDNAQVQALQAEIQSLKTQLQTVEQSQDTIQQTFQQQSQQSEREAKVVDLQKEHKLSPEDAEYTMRFFEAGEYGKGLKFAAGRSQVQQATETQLEQRATDREMAGRPVVPGGVQTAPAANEGILQAKIKEYQEAQGTDRDELAMWLLGNGGAEVVRKEALSVARNPVVPEVNLNDLRSEFANTDGIV